MKYLAYLEKFEKDFVNSFRDWVEAQFADHYTPSTRNVDRFICSVLSEYVNTYNLDYHISWSEFLEDWEIDEPFMEWFGD